MSSDLIFTKVSFQTLFPDILLEIFEHSLPKDEFPRPSILQAPLQLGRICSHWRRIALSYSPLWSRLRIGTDADDSAVRGRDHEVQDLEALRAFMVRSKNMPVSLMIGYHDGLLDKDLEPLLKELSIHRHRWKHLQLDVSQRFIPLIFLEIAEGVPLLRSLLVNCDFSTVWPQPRMRLDLRNAPQLDHLRLHHRAYWLVFPNTTSPCLKLRHLNTQFDLPGDFLFDWLRHLPDIEKLVVCYVAEPFQPIPSELILHNLTELIFTDPAINCEAILQLLDHIRAPNLRVFRVHFSGFDPNPTPTVAARVHGFLQRSAPPLRSLTIDYCRFPQDLLGILALVPSLEDLVISYGLASDIVIQGLINPSFSSTDAGTDVRVSPICPQLRSITLRDNAHLSEDMLVDMISSRCGNEGSGRLEQVTVDGTTGFYHGLLGNPRIMRCMAEGLEILLK